MGTGYFGGFGGTDGERSHVAEELIADLEKNGIKFTKEDIVFITKDETGQTVWLETGDSSAGLKHILDGNGQTPGHAVDFERAFGVSRDQLPSYLEKVISKGTVIDNKLVKKGSCEGYERTYYYEGNYYVITGIGTNGFVVSAYPKRRKDN